MRYSFDITVPANTLATAYHKQAIRLETGTITAIAIRFKAGCHNLVNVAIFDSLRQIVPGGETISLYGDDTTIIIPMSYELSSKPYEIFFHGWSETTRYAHTLSIWIDLLETAVKKDAGLLASLAHLLGGSQ